MLQSYGWILTLLCLMKSTPISLRGPAAATPQNHQNGNSQAINRQIQRQSLKAAPGSWARTVAKTSGSPQVPTSHLGTQRGQEHKHPGPRTLQKPLVCVLLIRQSKMQIWLFSLFKPKIKHFLIDMLHRCRQVYASDERS